MTAWNIQNEMLQIMSNNILRNVLDSVHEDNEFSIIIDETTDVSRKEQVSISVRTVGKQFEVRERFLGFYETSSITSEHLTDIIKDTFVRCSLSFNSLRGQCYDGASNMKGVHAGVQARIASIQPLAIYTCIFTVVTIVLTWPYRIQQRLYNLCEIGRASCRERV